MVTISNAERSHATRAALLDATITALIRFGYHGATSTRIAEISGLTRGAQMHHFKTKPALVAAALLHLHARQVEQWNSVLDDMGAHITVQRFIDVMWQSFEDELWLAASELWIAARTDQQLREALVPAEREIGQRIREDLGPRLRASHAGAAATKISARRTSTLIGLITATMRGIALHEAFDPDPRRSKAQRAELVAAVSMLLAD